MFSSVAEDSENSAPSPAIGMGRISESPPLWSIRGSLTAATREFAISFRPEEAGWGWCTSTCQRIVVFQPIVDAGADLLVLLRVAHHAAFCRPRPADLELRLDQRDEMGAPAPQKRVLPGSTISRPMKLASQTNEIDRLRQPVSPVR